MVDVRKAKNFFPLLKKCTCNLQELQLTLISLEGYTISWAISYRKYKYFFKF